MIPEDKQNPMLLSYIQKMVRVRFLKKYEGRLSEFTVGTLSKRGRQHKGGEARKKFLCNFTKHILTLVTLYVSIFAEILLTPASPPERNDGR